MAKGIGRKATDEELINYLEKRKEDEPLDLEIAFSKYNMVTDEECSEHFLKVE